MRPLDFFLLCAFLGDAAKLVDIESQRQGQVLTMLVKWGRPSIEGKS